jgi:serine/threonine protein kinase
MALNGTGLLEPATGLVAGMRLGNYLVEGRLGAGGQGSVHLARDVVLGRRAAVKALRESGEPRGAPASGLEEARLIATLDHRNIIRVYHVDRATFGWYIAMELCEGGSLAQRIRSSGPFHADAVLRVGMAVSAALGHAHGAGILHRDVKPGNVLLTAAGAIKVADFGLATRLSATNVDAVGTPLFCAPELWEGAPPAVSSDIFGLGATLFYLLEGAPPFRGRSASEVLEQAKAQRITFARESSEGIRDVIRACLAVDPSARPASAEAALTLLRDIARPASGPMVMTRPSPPVEESAPWQPIGTAFDRARERLDRWSATTAPLVVVHGASSSIELSLVENLLLTERKLPLILSVSVMASNTLLDVIGEEVGAGSGREGRVARISSMLALGAPMRPGVRGVVAVDVRRALTVSERRELLELSVSLEARRIRLVAFMASDEAAAITADAKTYAFVVDAVELPSLVHEERVDVLRAMVRADGAHWTPDAERLAAHLLGRTHTFETLVPNVLTVRRLLEAPIVTTFCVLAAAQQSAPIASLADMTPEWRAQPTSWPGTELLQLLADLRAVAVL